MNIQMTKEERSELLKHIGAVTGSASGVQMIAGMINDEALKLIGEVIEHHGWEILRMIDPEEYEKIEKHMEEADDENPVNA